jgi:hypothetical protein
LEEAMKKMSVRIVLCTVALLAFGMLVSGVAVAKTVKPKPAPAQKVAICHVRGNVKYVLISVAKSAIPAHEAHGDAYPGDIVLGKYVVEDDCSLTEATRVESPPVSLLADGCAVMLCAPDDTAVGGGYEPTPPDLPSRLAAPGDLTYCTLWGDTAGTSGWVVSNPTGSTQNLTTIFTLCTTPAD